VVVCALAAQGQILETVDVNIINQSFDPAAIRVVDEVCDVVAFEGARFSPTRRSRCRCAPTRSSAAT
jgi:hypothetical protein